ncbi:MAG TPA: allantoinase AllB [Thermoanaerobaculia bacterium]|nr:allantoinase AllB [Thermoanaerobaculia bacterium]
MPTDLVVRGRRVVTSGGIAPASIHVEEGRIAAVGEWDGLPPNVPVIEAGEAVVMPGLVDTHVHINEPGRTDWEGFETATRAAAAGGITTLVDMPLNSIPATTTREALRTKREAARGKCRVDVGFWGGVVPGNSEEIAGLIEDGVLGFKAFLVPSGVEEFQHVTEADLREAMPRLNGAVLLVHAELPGPLGTCEGDRYDDYLRSRPDAAETEAIDLLIRLSRELGARVHIVHLATAEALPLLRKARRDLPITVETCPHYLTFAAEEIPDGALAFKCAPPIRSRENRERLWEALREGLIDLVATDHSPSPPELKRGGFREAWGGIASLQLALPAVWTGARERGFSLQDLALWMSRNPARLAGLANKGAIQPGFDADLVIWEPEESFRVEPEALQHRHKLTPYAGRTLNGIVRRTLLRGETVYHDGDFPGPPADTAGRLLKGAG